MGGGLGQKADRTGTRKGGLGCSRGSRARVASRERIPKTARRCSGPSRSRAMTSPQQATPPPSTEPQLLRSRRIRALEDPQADPQAGHLDARTEDDSQSHSCTRSLGHALYPRLGHSTQLSPVHRANSDSRRFYSCPLRNLGLLHKQVHT